MTATDREHIFSEDLEANIRRKHAAYMHELERIENKGSDKALILSGGISALEDLRPELKESKGEKIRKEMIKYFTNGKEYLSLTSYSREDYIAWLEEQGEHNMGISEATKQELEDNLCKALEKETPESWNDFLEKQGEQNLNTDFSDIRTWKYIVDAVLTAKEGIGQYLDSPFTEEIAKKLQKRFHSYAQTSLNEAKKEIKLTEEDKKTVHLACEFIRHHSTPIDSIGGIDCSILIERLKSLIPQKQDVMSEDEFRHIVGYLVQDIVANEHMPEGEKQPTRVFVEKYYNKLRSQKQWKPSDAQIDSITCAVRNMKESACYDSELVSLLNDLKKLREK